MTNLLTTIVVICLACAGVFAHAQPAPVAMQRDVQEVCVKVYGAGGVAGLEAYQSGFFVSPEGHLATVDAAVLENGEVTVVTHNGDRYSGTVLGADPLLRIAVVKVEAVGEPFASVTLDQIREVTRGAPLLVFSNLFNIATGDEPVSVLRTHLAARTLRRSAFGPADPYGEQPVLILDAVTSNPGAAGGLLTDYAGVPVGMVGVERKGRLTGGWLSYAVPLDQVQSAVRQIIAGADMLGGRRAEQQRAIDLLSVWGFVLVESINARTPPYVDYVAHGSVAAEAGIRVDDLIVMVDGFVSGAVIEAERLLSIGRGEGPSLTVERNGRLIEVALPPAESRGTEE